MAEKNPKFDYRITHTDPHIGSLLSTIDDIKGQFKAGLRLTPHTIASLRQSVLITSTGSSTRIEGSKLSDAEVKKIMQRTAPLVDRDSQEVQGYLETLRNVFNAYADLPLRESLILSLHKALLKYSTKDELQRGHYKHKENMVGLLDEEGAVLKIMFETTRAFLTGKEMQELTEWTIEALEKKRFHPLLVIANFIIEFLKIHPFEDGNGRLSRVLTNLLLLRSGYSFVQYVSHEQIVEQRKDEYYLALRASQETFRSQITPIGEQETIAPWLNFFFSVLEEQAKKALMHLEEDNEEDTLSPKQYEVWKYVSGTSSASLGEITEVTGVVRATVRQALLRLVQLEKIKPIGRGRATRYIPVP